MKEKEKQLPGYLTLCNECQTGVLRLEYITYFTWLDQELITVPNFPAWICDMCGRRSYDTRAVSWLNTLLNPVAGKKNGLVRRRRGRLPGIDRPQP
jgi:YgiT-type zinc finger domain-containing protein